MGRNCEPASKMWRSPAVRSSIRDGSLIVRVATDAVCFHSLSGEGSVLFSGESVLERWSRRSAKRLAINVAEASSCGLPVSLPWYAGAVNVRMSAIMRSTEMCSSAVESQAGSETVDSREDPAKRGDARQLASQQTKQLLNTCFIRSVGTIAWTARFVARSTRPFSFTGEERYHERGSSQSRTHYGDR